MRLLIIIKKIRLTGLGLGISLALVGTAAACSSQPAPSPTQAPPPATTAKPSPAPAPAPKPATSPAAAGDLVSKGEALYQKTAGGMGCAACHGADAKGTPIAPSVRGKSAQDVKNSLQKVAAMSAIKVTDAEIEAVVAYLKSLQ